MTWPDALELVIHKTGHHRYRELCADANTDVKQRDAYRRLMLESAEEWPPPVQVHWPDPVPLPPCCGGAPSPS